MNKELKPCINDMCIMNNIDDNNHCALFLTDINNCTLSNKQSKKPESIYKKRWEVLKKELVDYIPCGDGYRDKHIILNGMMNRIENDIT